MKLFLLVDSCCIGGSSLCWSQRHRITAKKLLISLLISPLNGIRALGGEYWQLPLIWKQGGCQYVICILLCLMPVQKLPPPSSEGISRWARWASCSVCGVFMDLPRKPFAACAFSVGQSPAQQGHVHLCIVAVGTQFSEAWSSKGVEAVPSLLEVLLKQPGKVLLSESSGK